MCVLWHVAARLPRERQARLRTVLRRVRAEPARPAAQGARQCEARRTAIRRAQPNSPRARRLPGRAPRATAASDPERGVRDGRRAPRPDPDARMTLDLSLLPDGGVPWLAASGEHSDIVLSSRIRFARNVVGYAFTARARDGERLRILAQVREVLPRVPSLVRSVVLRLDELTPTERALLHERHLVSKELAGLDGAVEARSGTAVLVSDDAGVMVNEEDHLRLQVFRSGFDVAGALQAASRLERELGVEGIRDLGAEFG